MTDEPNFVVRPKVRFCPTDSNVLKAGESKHSMQHTNVKQSNKPKIRSIVTLNKPVKVVNPNTRCKIHEAKDVKVIDNTQKNDSLTVCTNQSPYTVHTTSSNDNPIETENKKPLNDDNCVRNIKTNCNQTDTKVFNKSSQDIVVLSPVSSVMQNKSLKQEIKPRKHIVTNVSKKNVKSKDEKENEVLNANKNDKNLIKKPLDLKVTKHKIKPCFIGSAIKQPNITNKISLTSKRNLNVKPNVMPCHKYIKTVPKRKTSPVKKTVIRDIIGPKIKPCIGPGVSHKKHNDLKILETKENTYTNPSISGEKFARPEYNSIMCTINKLNEMRKQKMITDIEHLPASYKHFINGKISTALDFPLDEAIYKNLVDLSIDENQLPTRLTRSKDPEPRQKDAAPILSDFFIPVSTEEYCTSASSKPRTPEMIENWNTFRISDKIFEWKCMLDRV